ncbi:hypothetical protein [Gordonia alkanivorans]|nr:hypothetical protein [Gordonia alkanivorans]YP_009324429.1 hypothetical protein BOX05_gp37 [Gordonia phage GAL1]AKJ72052.1 hypothetical protein GAL1_37 [Gordonia phage GAL1]
MATCANCGRYLRNDQLKAVGNGVCPPQAYRALELLHHIAFLELAS